MAGKKINNLRWYIVTLLFFATVINYLDRQTLSIAIPTIRDQYGLSNTDYSHIIIAFLLAYTIMQVVSGKVIDWLGTRKGFIIFISWWSLAAMLHGLATSTREFAMFRFVLGMGEAGNWPGAVKAVAEWFPSKEKSLAAGFFNSGSSLGAVAAPPLISWIIIQFGWRQGFVITGALGFLWLVPWVLFYDTPDKHRGITERELRVIREGRESQTATDTSPLRWVDLFRYRQLWALGLGRILSDPVWWFYVFWLPEYLKRQRDFSVAMIGMFAWIPFFAAGVGSLIGGGASSYLIKRGWSLGMARKTVLLISAGAMIAGIPAALTTSAAYSLAFISIATFSYASWAAVLIALLTDIFPKEVVASVYGITGTAAGFGGMTFTLITGRIVDKFSYLPVFMAAGLLPIIAALVLALLIGKIGPIALPTQAQVQSAVLPTGR